MTFAMVGGGGPDALPSRAGAERAGQITIGNLSVSETPQTITPAEITADTGGTGRLGGDHGGGSRSPVAPRLRAGPSGPTTSSC